MLVYYDSSNIMAISNIRVSLQTNRRHPLSGNFSGQSRFDFIPPTAFLCALIHTPNYTPGLGLRLSPQDFRVFEGLTKVLPDVGKLMKTLKSKTDESNQNEVDGES